MERLASSAALLLAIAACSKSNTCNVVTPCSPAGNACHLGKLDCQTNLCLDQGQNAPDGTACGTGLTCSLGVCGGAARTVTGAFKTTYWVDSGTQTTSGTPQPAGTSVAILSPDSTSAGYTQFSTTLAADGTFSVSSVPGGHYFLRTDTPYKGYIPNGTLATLIDTELFDFTASSPPLTKIVGRRPDLKYASQATPVTVNFSGMDPWVNGQQLWLDSAQSDSDVLVTQTTKPAAGATSASIVYDWQGAFPWSGLPSAASGDVLFAYQRENTFVPAGTTSTTVRTTKKIATVSATVADGTASTITVALASANLSESLPADMRTTQFAALAAQVNPAATTDQVGMDFGVYANAHALDATAPDAQFRRLLYVYGDGKAPDTNYGSLPFGGFLEPMWKEFRRVTFTYDVSYTPPGATTASTYYATYWSEEPLAGLATGPIVPLLSPVRSPLLNGKDAFTAQTGVGLQPTISWSAPSTGSPSAYQVGVVSLADPTVDNGFNVRVQGALTLKVPPGLLKSGNSYFAVITALQGSRFALDTSPWNRAYPWQSADCVTGIFKP